MSLKYFFSSCLRIFYSKNFHQKKSPLPSEQQNEIYRREKWDSEIGRNGPKIRQTKAQFKIQKLKLFHREVFAPFRKRKGGKARALSCYTPWTAGILSLLAGSPFWNR
ncbi:hypothetical protein AABB24_000374 [Solanum stoloniferum]|uniref:Uncharacterized protein n=1 Tax=Solanum stoloniferum TaxID=62892 RepID=A0ABD2VGR1_9SOLN